MTTNQAKAPISAHPLFPAVVALWFAVLFGLGCAVLPTLLFERIVTFTGLSAIVPAAAPPLGFTARIVFSLVAAITAAGAGFILARRLANAQYIERPSPVIEKLTPKSNAAQRSTARRPISVKDELGDTKLDPIEFKEPAPHSTPIPGRRRSLALSEDAWPDDFFNVAPLPGSESEWAHTALEDPAIEELAEERHEPEAFAAPSDAGDAPLDFDPPVFSKPEADVAPALEPQTIRAAPAAPASAPTRPVLPTDPEADLEKLGIVQLAERLGHSLQQRLERPKAPAPDFAARLSDAFLPGIAGDAAFDAEDIPAPGAAIFGQAAFEPAVPVVAAVPAALHPIPIEVDAFEDDEDEDSHVPSLSLPLTGLSPAAVWDGEEDEDEIEDAEGEENYSSLLAIKHPARMPTEFVRTDEPDSLASEIAQVGILPGANGASTAADQPPPAIEGRAFDAPTQIDAERNAPNADETDRALRSALAVLQRMSGAA